jgi:hypothetical protein
MTLRTLADVRTLLSHVPAERRQLNTWCHVAKCLDDAARGGDVASAVIALRMVLELERVPLLGAPQPLRFGRVRVNVKRGRLLKGEALAGQSHDPSQRQTA